MTARLCDIRGRRNGCRLAGGQGLFSQDLDDALFTIAGLLDFRANLIPGEPDRLQLEYLKGRGYPDLESPIRRALLGIAAVRIAVEKGRLMIWGIHAVQNFPASHTLKRSIMDRRE